MSGKKERKHMRKIENMYMFLLGKLNMLEREDGKDITEWEVGHHLGRQAPFLWSCELPSVTGMSLLFSASFQFKHLRSLDFQFYFITYTHGRCQGCLQEEVALLVAPTCPQIDLTKICFNILRLSYR